jgi:Flp pilus assembly protein TadD
MQMSPHDHMIGTWHVELGDAEISLGHFNAATDEYRKAIDSGTRTFFAYTNLAAAYAHAGKMEDAQGALVEARKLNPKLTVKWMIEHTSGISAILDGLRKAGLPEE